MWDSANTASIQYKVNCLKPAQAFSSRSQANDLLALSPFIAGFVL